MNLGPHIPLSLLYMRMTESLARGYICFCKYLQVTSSIIATMVMIRPPGLEVLPLVPVLPDIYDSFQSTPWASALFSDPNLRPCVTPTRSSRSSRENTLISKTLATPTTLKAWQSFYRSPTPKYPLGECLTLLSIERDLNGYKDTMHGGVVSLLLDECMGHAAYSYRDPDTLSFTASMKIDFKRPVKTPAIILCRSWLDGERSQGRKMWIRGVIEDGDGVVYASGKSLYLEVDAGRANL